MRYPVPLPGTSDPTLQRWAQILLSDPPTRTVTSAYTAQAHDFTIRVDTDDAGVTVTLPPAALLSGKVYAIKNIGSSGNDVTVDANDSEEIDGSTTLTLADGAAAIIQSNSASWDILAEKA